MPAGTAVAKAESRIKREAGKKRLKGRRAARYVYGALNNAGLMHGNKSTAKGLSKAQHALARRPRTAADY